MCLFNVRSWNDHLEHFLSDKIYLTCSSLFYFTETSINDSPAKHIDEILDENLLEHTKWLGSIIQRE